MNRRSFLGITRVTLFVIACLAVRAANGQVAAPGPVAAIQIQRADSDPKSPILAGTSFKVKVILQDASQRTIPESSYSGYKITLTTGDSRILTDLAQEEDRSGLLWTLAASQPGTAYLVAHALAVGSATGVSSDPFAVSVTPNNQPLRVSVDIMDDVTARSLFGKRIANQFFVLHIGLTNTLPHEKAGDKLVVFSPSVELNVTFEQHDAPGRSRRRSERDRQASSSDGRGDAGDGRREQPFPPHDGWSEVTYQDVISDYNYALGTHAQPVPDLGPALDELLRMPQYAIPAADREPLIGVLRAFGLTVDADAGGQKPYAAELRLVRTNLARLNVRQRAVLMNLLADLGITVQMVPQGYLEHRFLYKPYSYEIMLGTFDAQAPMTTRNRVISKLRFLGAVATAVVGVAGLHPNVTTESIVGAYNGGLIPAIEKVWPDLTETERQNLVNRALRTVEQVPYGDVLDRVMFVPRTTFSGFIPGKLVRIASVHTNYFRVNVGVVHDEQALDAARTPDAGPM